MRYRLTRQAITDLIDLTEYGIESFGQEQANIYLAGLYRTFDLIAELSAMGRAVPQLGKNLRRFEHGRHSIFYKVRGDHVEIGRVIDNRRDMRRQFRPLDQED